MAHAKINTNVLAEQRQAERDRFRRIVAGLPQGAGATSTFLSQAVWMLLDFKDAIKDRVVITQGMGNEDDPDQIQALAAFNTGLNTVNELFGYGFFGSCTITVLLFSYYHAFCSLHARASCFSSGYHYKALAEGIFREALNFGATRTKGKHSLSGKQLVRAAEWHGFVCNQGVGKNSLKAAKRPLSRRVHPYQKRK
jgi:hypothetical protein